MKILLLMSFTVGAGSLPIKIIVIKIKLKKVNSPFCCCITHLLHSLFLEKFYYSQISSFILSKALLPIKINVIKNYFIQSLTPN